MSDPAIPDQGPQPGQEIERYGLLIAPLHGVVEVQRVGAELAAVRSEEAAMVLAAMPSDSLPVDPSAPEESLVILEAAKNVSRLGDDKDEVIFVHFNNRRFLGKAQEKRVLHSGLPEYRYYELDKQGRPAERSSAYSIEATEPWARTAEELGVEVDRRQALEELRTRYLAEHPLGEGAVLVTNRYGGIDPTLPEATTRSLLTRLLYADQLGLANKLGWAGSKGPYAEHGLLDFRLESMLGNSWLQLVKDISPSLTMVKQMQQLGPEVMAQALPAVEQLVRTHVTTFLEEWGDSLMLGASLLKDSDTTEHVLGSLFGIKAGKRR